MNVPLVMTVIGKDRPGLVGLLSGLIADHQGNWLESRMSHLGAHFAGILRVEVPAERHGPLIEALRNLQTKGLTVVVHPDEQTPPSPAHLIHLELVGQDRPGIVRQISQALAEHKVNVEELHTECVSAAMSGETLFQAQAQVHVPDSCQIDRLKADLERIAADLMVEIKLAAPPSGS